MTTKMYLDKNPYHLIKFQIHFFFKTHPCPQQGPANKKKAQVNTWKLTIQVASGWLRLQLKQKLGNVHSVRPTGLSSCIGAKHCSQLRSQHTDNTRRANL